MQSPGNIIPECAFVGNADLYGVGVRVGVYVQWVATLITTVFDPKNESSLRLLNFVIQTSIFLVLCTESAQRQNAISSVITQFLLCGSLSSVTGDGIVSIDHVSGILRIFFYTALSAYSIWFWFVGIDNMLPAACLDVNFAFFGPSTLNGWFRTLGKALSVAGLVACITIAVYSVRATVRRFKPGLLCAFVRRPQQQPQVEIALMLLSIGLIAMSIAVVEYLIVKNNIKGVGKKEIGSVAQLIPLQAGILPCLLVLWRIYHKKLVWEERDWLLFGKPLLSKRHPAAQKRTSIVSSETCCEGSERQT